MRKLLLGHFSQHLLDYYKALADYERLKQMQAEEAAQMEDLGMALEEMSTTNPTDVE